MSRADKPSSSKRKRRKVALLKSGSNVCRGCYQRFLPSKLTIDHITPLSRGGSSELDNLQLMCRPCNQKKADRVMA